MGQSKHYVLIHYLAAKWLQSCPALCDPIDGSQPGSPVPGILQARLLEWVAISFSNAWKWKVKVKSLSRVRLFATPGTAAHQAPLSMGFSRHEYWSGVPLPSLNWVINSPILYYKPKALSLNIFSTHSSYEVIFSCISKVLVIQSCPTLCDPMNCNLSGSSVHRILQQEH